MQRRRYAKFAARATMVVALLLASIAALVMVEQRRTRAELGAILSDLIGERVLHYAPDPGHPSNFNK